MGCFFALLGVDRPKHFSHQCHLGMGNHRKHIAREMDGTALVLGFGKHLAHSFQHSQTLIANYCFLIQFADGGRRYFSAPQSLRDVLYPAH